MSTFEVLIRLRDTLLLSTIEDCIRRERTMPALILLYSGIDIFGSLEVPKATRSTFIAWTDEYLVKRSDLRCTAIDLYSARCGILHSMSAESQLTRDGDARQVIYAWGSAREQLLQSIADAQGRSACAIHLEDLTAAFKLGVDTYIADVQKEPARMSKVLDTLQSVFTNIPIR